jgi:hypothetical protein
VTDETTPPPIRPPKRRGRPPGLPRTPGSGRKKGVPNRINGDIHALMKALGCDPRVVLIRICANVKNPPELRRKAAADLMQYAWPKLASTEQHVTGEMQQTVVQVICGVQRLPTDPIDVTPQPAALGPQSTGESVTTSPALAAPAAYTEVVEAEASISAPGGSESRNGWRPTGGEVRRPSPPPVEAPRPALSPASDPRHDDRLQYERRDDAKVAELNSRAAKFVA